MAEFGFASDSGGHTWNNALAHATYEENVEKHGAEAAREYLRKDIWSFIQEQKGEDYQWSLTLQGGRMVTETGVSLEEMTANITQGRYSSLVPENIKATAPLEAATLREATRLAVEGAEKIILPEQHLDAHGNIVSRYLSVWTKSTVDPRRYDGSRIDLGKNIRIEDVRTGTSFIAFEKEEAISFRQDPQHKLAFALAIHTGANNSFSEIKHAMVTKIYRSHQETYTRPFDSVPRQTLQKKAITQENYRGEKLIGIPSKVFRDSRETVRGVEIYLHNKKRQQEIREVEAVRQDTVIENRSEQASERVTLAKIREKPVRVFELITKHHKQMRVDARAIAMIAETGIAIHATPLILGRLAEPLPAPIRAVEKSIRRHEKNVRKAPHFAKASMVRREAGETSIEGNPWKRLGTGRKSLEKTWDKKEKGKKDHRKVQSLRSEGGNSFRMVKERKSRVKRGRENGIKRIAAASEITPSASEKREKKRLRRAVEKSMRRHEKRELRMKNKELRRIAKRETKKDSVKGQPLIEKKRSMQRKEREMVAGIVFGWMVWMILIRKDSETPKNIFIRHRLASQDDVLQNKEETPWVLRAIIYYLTAIREQGMQTNPTNPTNTPIRPIRNTQALPQHAVIFAYTS